jgi:uncharacterized DUF497 family protein
MIDEEFEWDDAKAAGNLRKHRVGFGAARLVFQDASAVEEFDAAGAYGDERFKIVGLANDLLLTVIYTERAGRIRVISARRATRREQNDYHQNQTSA